MLLHGWAKAYLSTLPNYDLYQYIAVNFRVTLSAANQNRVLPHPKAAKSADYGAGSYVPWWLEQDHLLLYHLSCYIAELFPILKHCWGILYLITLLRFSQSWNIADVYPHLLPCWVVPKLKTLLMYSVCYYMAELKPILLHCRTMVYLKMLPSVFV